MKILFRGALVLWLVSGVALHVYSSRAAQGTVAVEPQRGLHLRPSENNDEAALRTRESQWHVQSKIAVAYAAWGFVGFLLALRGVHLLFRKADRIADVEKFLAGSLVLLLLHGCMRPPFEPVKLEADANAYQIQEAREDLAADSPLTRIEPEAKRSETWDGEFPTSFLGTAGSTPDRLLQMPAGLVVETARR